MCMKMQSILLSWVPYVQSTDSESTCVFQPGEKLVNEMLLGLLSLLEFCAKVAPKLEKWTLIWPSKWRCCLVVLNCLEVVGPGLSIAILTFHKCWNGSLPRFNQGLPYANGAVLLELFSFESAFFTQIMIRPKMIRQALLMKQSHHTQIRLAQTHTRDFSCGLTPQQRFFLGLLWWVWSFFNAILAVVVV